MVPIENEWPADGVLQKIAIENNLTETAFFQKKGHHFQLRWFTPEFEVDLCGHAMLATVHVIFHHFGYAGDRLIFHSMSGTLEVAKEDGLLLLDFPSGKPVPYGMDMARPEAFNT